MERVLHSGEFTDRFDNNYRVTYKKEIPDYGLNVIPSSLIFDAEGGSDTVTATANSPYKPILLEAYDWITITDETPSSVSEKTYTITLSENEGNLRIATIYARIENAPASEVQFPITIVQNSIETEYLKFMSIGVNWIGIINEGNNQPNIEFSRDGETWTTWQYSDIRVNDGEVIYMRGNNPDGFNFSYQKYSHFKFTGDGRLTCQGNIMSLIDRRGNTNVIPNDFCFSLLFFNCTSLRSSPKLPATTLADSCYRYMFSGCTRLVNAPELPATTLADHCYYEMFDRCESLTRIPQLPATTLATSCYAYMFSGCTSLVNAPELPATTLTPYCYNGMFGGCSSLVNAPELPVTTLANVCYGGMFAGCSSLTQAPELPATTLAEGCYSGMFRNCTSLTTAPELPATTLAEGCYSSMFSDCTSLVNAPELNSIHITDGCYFEMFYGCTSLVNAPKLPATTLADSCYRYMFSGCTRLVNAPELPATTLATYCYGEMFRGCLSLVNAPELPATTLTASCYEFMFDRCKRLKYIKCLATNPDRKYSFDWLYYASTTGTFYKHQDATWVRSVDGIPEGWTVIDAYIIETGYDALNYNSDGVGPTSISVYCKDGQAYMLTSLTDWFVITKTGEESVIGSDYKRYIYSISVEPNIDRNARESDLTFRVEGVPSAQAKKTVRIHQDGQQ